MNDWSMILTELVAGRDLTSEVAGWAMGQVVRGEATSVQLAAFLVALRAKGETAAERQRLSRGANPRHLHRL